MISTGRIDRLERSAHARAVHAYAARLAVARGWNPETAQRVADAVAADWPLEVLKRRLGPEHPWVQALEHRARERHAAAIGLTGAEMNERLREIEQER